MFFFSDIFGFKGLVAEFEQVIAPLIILRLADLILGAEFADFDLSG